MKLKIREKIVILFLAVLFIVGIFTVKMITDESKQAVQDAVMDTVTTTIHMAGKYTEQKLNAYLEVLEELAAQDAYIGDTINVERASILNAECAKRNGYDRVNYADKNGINGDGLDFSEREYFVRCKESKMPVISELYESKTVPGQMSILFAVPIITQKGEFGGIVYTAADAQLLSDLVSDISAGASSSVLVLDKEGTVIASQEEGLVYSKCNFLQGNNTSASFTTEGMYGVSEKMVNGEEGYDITESGGDTFFSVYMPICEDNGWSICISGNMADFMTGYYAGIQKILLMLAVIVVLAVIVIVFVSRLITKPIVAVTDRMQLLAEGDLHAPTPQINSKDETQVLADAIDMTVITLRSMITKISDILGKMAGGDFTQNVDGEYKGDLLPIKEALNNILGALRQLLQEIDAASSQVLFGSNNVAQLSEALASAVTEQTAIMDKIRENAIHISEEADHNAKNAQDAVQLATEAMDSVETGSRQMEMLIDAMAKMEKSSQEIQQINKNVSDIAFQTNILALNASVEAARAGSAGKGFAVVADEVRTLAEKAAIASQNASDFIEETVATIQNGIKVAKKSSASMEEVVTRTRDVQGNIRNIADMSQEQMKNLEYIMESISQIADALTSTAASSQQSAATAQELNSQALNLENLVKKFQV